MLVSAQLECYSDGCVLVERKYQWLARLVLSSVQPCAHDSHEECARVECESERRKLFFSGHIDPQLVKWSGSSIVF